jgi:hypothetical protein
MKEAQMRFALVVVMAAGLLLGGAVAPATAIAADASYTVALDDQQQPPTGRLEVDVDTNQGGGAWYTSPMWIAIGVIALILLIVLIVMATRGGGTTIVRD